MSARKRRKQKKKTRGKQQTLVALDYYQRPFILLHEALENSGYSPSAIHAIRKRFWQFARPGMYDMLEARGYLLQYIRSVEDCMAELFREQSLAYFLHVYRRLSPRPIGTDTQPQTIGITRAVFEAAIHKYTQPNLCNRIASSKQVAINEVLGGLLLAEEFEVERYGLANSPDQLVLTHFDHAELIRFYDIEKLAYEIWRASATIRCIAKGAPFIVTDDSDSYRDERAEELAYLLEHYDNRRREIQIAATGAIFNEYATGKGCVFLPAYNLGGLTLDDLSEVMRRLFNFRLIQPLRFNFVWIPFNLRGFRLVHLPLADSFQKQHGVSLDAVLAVIASLCARALSIWLTNGMYALVRMWQRCYEGCYTLSAIREEIKYYLPAAADILKLESDAVSIEDLNVAIDFWSLSDKRRTMIDLAYPGPHSIFLPAFDEKWFIDYAWILRRLFDLFLGISVSDQNFKGDALENSLHQLPSVLPRIPCVADDGSKKQVDWAFGIGCHLLIAECKAVGKSIGFDRGDPTAIDYRQNKVVERTLTEANDKAQWIAKRPRGRNYDITGFQDILPVGVSPFEEFIPSKRDFYWIAEGVPRVLTPSELRELVLKNPGLLDTAMNRIPIQKMKI